MGKPKAIVSKHAGQHPKGDAGSRKFKKWINDYEAASSWLEKYDLEKLLIEGDGICKITNFLPAFVAEGILSMLEGIPDEAWNVRNSSAAAAAVASLPSSFTQRPANHCRYLKQTLPPTSLWEKWRNKHADRCSKQCTG